MEKELSKKLQLKQQTVRSLMFGEKKSEDPKLTKGRRLTKMRLMVENKNADKMKRQQADKEELLKKL